MLDRTWRLKHIGLLLGVERLDFHSACFLAVGASELLIQLGSISDVLHVLEFGIVGAWVDQLVLVFSHLYGLVLLNHDVRANLIIFLLFIYLRIVSFFAVGLTRLFCLSTSAAFSLLFDIRVFIRFFGGVGRCIRGRPNCNCRRIAVSVAITRRCANVERAVINVVANHRGVMNAWTAKYAVRRLV